MYWSYNNIYTIFYYLGILDILLAEMLIYKINKKLQRKIEIFSKYLRIFYFQKWDLQN
jgi:hypothetical protein